MQKAVISGKVSTVVPIEIARRNQQSAVREELLLRTDVNQVSLGVARVVSVVYKSHPLVDVGGGLGLLARAAPPSAGPVVD